MLRMLQFFDAGETGGATRTGKSGGRTREEQNLNDMGGKGKIRKRK
jgi:hypothetical protein